MGDLVQQHSVEWVIVCDAVTTPPLPVLGLFKQCLLRMSSCRAWRNCCSGCDSYYVGLFCFSPNSASLLYSYKL